MTQTRDQSSFSIAEINSTESDNQGNAENIYFSYSEATQISPVTEPLVAQLGLLQVTEISVEVYPKTRLALV